MTEQEQEEEQEEEDENKRIRPRERALGQKSNISKWFFDICNAVMAQWRQKIMKFGHSKSIFCKIHCLITSILK